MRLGFASRFGRILRDLFLDAWIGNSRPGDIAEIGHGHAKLRGKIVKDLDRRVPFSPLRLLKIPKGDGGDLLLCFPREEPSLADVAAESPLKVLKLHGHSFRVDETENPTTTMGIIKVMWDMRNLRLVGGIGAAALLLGCSGLMDAMAPQGGAESKGAACTERAERRFDFGAGSASDIASRSKGFYALRPDGWVPPSQPFAMEDDRAVKQGIQEKNAKLIWSLRESVGNTDTEINSALVKDIEIGALSSPSNTKQSVFVAAKYDEDHVALLVAPGTCPHFNVVDACIEGNREIKVETMGEVPCFGGSAFDGEGVTVRFTARYHDHELPYDASAPLHVVRYSDLGLTANNASDLAVRLVRDGEPFWGQDISLNQGSKISPEAIEVVLRTGGLEEVAQAALSGASQTLDNMAALGAARLQGTEAEIEAAHTPREVVEMLDRLRLNKGLPDDPGVMALVFPVIEGATDQVLSLPKAEGNFLTAIDLLDAALRRPRDALLVPAATPDMKAALKDMTYKYVALKDKIEKVYGPLIADGTVSGDEAISVFVENYAKSEFTRTLMQRLQKEREDQLAEAKKRQAEEAAMYEEAAKEQRRRCASTCQHKCMHPKYANKALCQKGCENVECGGNMCEGYCQADCSTTAKAGISGCSQACITGRCQ